mgnify:FL=1
MKNWFYNIIRVFLKINVYLFFHPKVKGKENILESGSIVLAGNHTKWLDPLLLIATVPRKIHFMAKIELFKGIEGVVVRGMGCIPVNRKIHDKDSLKSAKDELRKGEVIGIFPEGTINRTDEAVMPFKIGAVKMTNDTDSLLVPFVIKGKYNIIGKSVSIEFLKSRKITDDLDSENKKLMDDISKKLEEFNWTL